MRERILNALREISKATPFFVFEMKFGKSDPIRRLIRTADHLCPLAALTNKTEPCWNIEPEKFVRVLKLDSDFVRSFMDASDDKGDAGLRDEILTAVGLKL